MRTEHLRAAFSVILVLGCSRVECPMREPECIGFGTAAAATRVEENVSADVMDRGFKVTSPNLMDNVRAEYSGSLFRTGVFWPSDRPALDFYAVFPPEYDITREADGVHTLYLGSDEESFECSDDILVASFFGAGSTPVPLEFVHPLCYISKFNCRLADNAPDWFSVLVDGIYVGGIPEYGVMTFPDKDGGTYRWTYGGNMSREYCKDAGIELTDSSLTTVEGDALLLIPTADGRYTATLSYRTCSFGKPSEEKSSSFTLELHPGMRGSANIVFNSPSDGEDTLSFSLTLEPWASDETYNHIIKLY